MGGCKGEPKAVSERDAKEAAVFASEAEFAMKVREWARAEEQLAKAVKLAPDPIYYHNLGMARMRQKNRAGAKEAYQAALDLCDRLAAANKGSADPWVKKVYLLALLGRVDDARALVKKIDKDFPTDRAVRALVDAKRLEEFIASPTFKEVAL